jgi:transposase-like protein
MGRKNFTPEQIIRHLRDAEILLGKGSNIAQACKKIGVSEQTYYRWRREYGGMQVEQARRLKELEKENSRLKRLVADLHLDKSILEEALKGNY